MKLNRLLLALLGLCVGGAASAAGPVRCSPGFQDSSCVGVLLNAPQVAPTCAAAGTGWTTTTPATWAGSKYTQPKCSYTAAPTCPSGYDQTAAPTWNGTSWVGLACQPQALPSPPTTPLVLQPITVSAEMGANFAVGSIIQITGTTSTVTFTNLNPKPTQATACTVSPGQTCYLGFSTGSDPDPYGLNAVDAFNQCALDYTLASGGYHGTYFAATLNPDTTISITAISIANGWIGQGAVSNFFNNGVIPASYSSGSYRLPLDSYNTNGSGSGGRCWPNTGGSGG